MVLRRGSMLSIGRMKGFDISQERAHEPGRPAPVVASPRASDVRTPVAPNVIGVAALCEKRVLAGVTARKSDTEPEKGAGGSVELIEVVPAADKAAAKKGSAKARAKADA